MRLARRLPQGHLILAVLLTLAPESCPKEEKADPKPWANKDWTQWTELESRNVLLRSPWSDHYTYYTEAYSHFDPDRGPISVLHSVTIVQWRTALPIRRAHLRRKQIESKYDQMSDTARAEFNALTDEEIAKAPDRIILRVVFLQKSDSADDYYLPREAVLLLADGRILVSSDAARTTGRREQDPVWGWVLRHEVDFVFPRVIEDGPVIKPGDASVTVLIGFRSGVTFHPTRRFEFKPAEMIYNGRLEY